MSRSTRSGTSSHRLQDKCASVSYVSPCSIVAIIITSQSCALTIGLQVLIVIHTYTTRMVPGPHYAALAVPGRRVPSRYPIPRREACSNPGLTTTRQLTIWAHRHRDLAPPLPVSGRFSFAANRPAHALTRPLRLPCSFYASWRERLKIATAHKVACAKYSNRALIPVPVQAEGLWIKTYVLHTVRTWGKPGLLVLAPHSNPVVPCYAAGRDQSTVPCPSAGSGARACAATVAMSPLNVVRCASSRVRRVELSSISF